jgi:glycine hydroxymethyltransferase
MVPFDDKSAFTTSGIRLGTAAITTRGLKEADMEVLAGFINEVVMNINDDHKIGEVRKKVNQMMEGKALFNY